jgi:hypothetical protein
VIGDAEENRRKFEERERKKIRELDDDVEG